MLRNARQLLASAVVYHLIKKIENMSKKFYFSIVFVICIFCNSLGQEKQTIIRGTTFIKGYNEIAFAGFEENPISDIGKEYIVQPDSNNCFHLNISLAHFTELLQAMERRGQK